MQTFSGSAARLLGAVALASSVACSAQVDVLTEHNDNFRTGVNARETTLTPANVDQRQFGMWRQPTDGTSAKAKLVVRG